MKAFNRRDLDAFLVSVDEEVERSRGSWQSRAAITAFRGYAAGGRTSSALFPDYEIELEEIRDLGDVTLSHFKGWGHRVCLTESEALEAAGLAE
jgi:hypothetical protein